ncbi:MAG: outer membrane lipoprotein carrier protein LolA [Bacteroidales bacterium]|nr:outer membrane lipoprotein carrier protein LolA [Bacteroidales bacterium]
MSIRLLLCFFVLLGPVSAIYAEPVTGEELQVLAGRVKAASEAVNTLQGRFIQTKTLSILSDSFRSEGVLYFTRPQKLRWQYTTPYRYDFIMDGHSVTMRSEQSSQTIDADGNRIFRQLCAVIAGGVDGSLLTSDRDFDITWQRSDSGISAELRPKNRPFKDLFARIVITLRNEDCMVQRIMMEETGGDTTEILFTECKVNQPIDDAVYETE